MDGRQESLDQVTIIVHRTPGQFAPAFLAGFLILTISILTLSAALRTNRLPHEGLAASQSVSAASDETLTFGSVAWSAIEGEWDLEGGRLVFTSQNALALAEIASSHYEFEVAMRADGVAAFNGQMPRLLFRYQGPEDYYALYLLPDGSLVLGRMSGGVWIRKILSAEAGADPREFHTYRVRDIEGHIRIWFDSREMLSLVDAPPEPSGSVGVTSAYGQASFVEPLLTYPTSIP